MSTPAYRESKNRLADMDWNTCRQNLANWADKGAMLLNKLIPSLKNLALQKGADVNVDETWHRFQVDIEHLCCLAHSRAKFKKALDQGCEKARFFLEKMGKLYRREDEYRRLDLPPEEIRKKRNDEYTNKIVEDLWNEYTIDNLAAERAIRPLTVQRKNSLFFGSTKGAVNSAIYNTFIETCKQNGISFRDYFRKLMNELKSGRTDYDNLLPMTIGIK